jgi:hypothetical protein
MVPDLTATMADPGCECQPLWPPGITLTWLTTTSWSCPALSSIWEDGRSGWPPTIQKGLNRALTRSVLVKPLPSERQRAGLGSYSPTHPGFVSVGKVTAVNTHATNQLSYSVCRDCGDATARVGAAVAPLHCSWAGLELSHPGRDGRSTSRDDTLPSYRTTRDFKNSTTSRWCSADRWA